MENTEVDSNEVLEKFLAQFDQLIKNSEASHIKSLELEGRLFELEKAVGYLLSKDVEWMAGYQAAMAKEGEQHEQASGFVAPQE